MRQGNFAALSNPSPNIDHYAAHIWSWPLTLTSKHGQRQQKYITFWPRPLTYNFFSLTYNPNQIQKSLSKVKQESANKQTDGRYQNILSPSFMVDN